jgi:hypothetical protein
MALLKCTITGFSGPIARFESIRFTKCNQRDRNIKQSYQTNKENRAITLTPTEIAVQVN